MSAPCPVACIRNVTATSKQVSSQIKPFQKAGNSHRVAAIQFNKQECAAVNETAPDFVGCSPAGLSSVLASMTLTPATPATASTATSTASSSSADSQVSTITGDIVPETAADTTGTPLTATFGGKPLMTGSCTVPYFALITGPNAMVTEFPAIGCSDERKDCCPFDQGQNAVITRCPQDYFTTASGCCPM